MRELGCHTLAVLPRLTSGFGGPPNGDDLARPLFVEPVGHIDMYLAQLTDAGGADVFALGYYPAEAVVHDELGVPIDEAQVGRWPLPQLNQALDQADAILRMAGQVTRHVGAPVEFSVVRWPMGSIRSLGRRKGIPFHLNVFHTFANLLAVTTQTKAPAVGHGHGRHHRGQNKFALVPDYSRPVGTL